MKDNKILINGGSINANNLVVGDNANINSDNQSIVINQNDIEQISKMIDEFITRLNTTQQPIKDKEDIISAVTTLKGEINKEKPSKITLSSIGKTVLENLKYVKDVVPYFHLIWDKVSALIS